MLSVSKEQSTALAGILTASRLVDDIATQGQCNQHHEAALLQSVFKFNATNTLAVFGDSSNLKPGIQLFDNINNNIQQPIVTTCMQYAMSLFHLAKQLDGNKNLQSVLKQRLKSLTTPKEFNGWLQSDFIESLANVYVDTIGSLSMRIQVKGQSEFLQKENNANHIRSILLAGIRAAYLWNQLGGNRLQLFTSRRQINQHLLSL